MAHALVIEDEILIAMQIEAILEAAGILTIDIATTEEDAILLALAHRPDIITSDVRLAKGDGPHAVKTIAQSIGTIPVIFITGSPEECSPCDPPAVILPKPLLAGQLEAALYRLL